MESLGGLLFPLLILVLFVPIFLSSRKQRRQMVEMQQLQGSLQVGDVVTTTSGLRGTVVDASYEETIDLEIAEDVVTTWMRVAVRDKVADTSAALAETDEPGVVDHGDVERGVDTPSSGTSVSDTAVSGADGASLDGPDGRTSAGAHGDAVVAPDTRSDANGSARP